MVVAHWPGLVRCPFQAAEEQVMSLCLAAGPGRLAAQPVERLVPRGGDDPATRVRRHPVAWPAFGGDGERLLDRVLRDVDVAEDAGQGRHRDPGAIPEGTLDRVGHWCLGLGYVLKRADLDGPAAGA